jgi:predicted RNA-binding protein
LSIGDSSIWLIRGNTEREWSYILIVQEEAIIFIDIFGHQKLVQDDLLDLADTAVKKAS